MYFFFQTGQNSFERILQVLIYGSKIFWQNWLLGFVFQLSARTRKLWNGKTTFKLKLWLKSFENETQQLCSLNRPVSLNKWFNKLNYFPVLTTSNTLIYCFACRLIIPQVSGSHCTYLYTYYLTMFIYWGRQSTSEWIKKLNYV